MCVCVCVGEGGEGGGGWSGIVAVKFISRPHPPALVAALSPKGAVRATLHCSQDHLQRELLVPPVQAQPTVTASLRCSTAVIAIHRHVDHWASTIGLTKGNAHLSEPVVVVVVFVVVVVSDTG